MYVVCRALWTFACFLHQVEAYMSHLSDSQGLVDPKCFQMCVGSDLFALSEAPQARGPSSLIPPSLAPSFSPVGVPLDGLLAQRMTYKHLTPFSTTSGAYYRGDSPREQGGKSLREHVCVCAWEEVYMCKAYVCQGVYIFIDFKKHLMLFFQLNCYWSLPSYVSC